MATDGEGPPPQTMSPNASPPLMILLAPIASLTLADPKT